MTDTSLGLLAAAVTDLAARLEDLDARLTDTADPETPGGSLQARLEDLEAGLSEVRSGLARLSRARAARDDQAQARRPWHELTREQAQARWQQLHDWVGWLVARNNIGPKEIPDCWYLHTGLVDELETLRWAWLDTSSTESKMTEPLWWRESLHRARNRWPSYNPNGCSTSHSPTRSRAVTDHPGWYDFLAHELADRPADPADDAG